ncbi:zf-HC2 domain-containing protein [Dechloromonas sp. ARDL1]|uniref:zf-HC2 domain-containing protein n=1 Tax=Dechloromonas sp. ARDL1 TaxID=3322121 RepID=UPI003DA74F96
MLNCKDATRLMSEAQDRPLSVGEKLQLEMHLAMCRGCRNFREQMDFLRLACRRYLQRRDGNDDGSSP